MSVPSRSEVFAKLVDLVDQIISTSAVMAHLHQTESSDKDKKLAVGWLMISEVFKKIRHKVVLMGQGRLN